MSDSADNGSNAAPEEDERSGSVQLPGEDDEDGEDLEQSDGANVGNDGRNQAQDSSEEEEEDNEYDLTDQFIAQEDEEEDDGEEAGEGTEGKKRKHKRKRRREKAAEELDDDDYQLLADNQAVGFRAKKPSERKRIRKQLDTRNRTEAQRLQEELFGEDNDGEVEEEGLEDNRPSAAVSDEFDVSEDDFIDDDDGEGPRRKSRLQSKGTPQGVSSYGIQEMQDIFGDVDDLLEMYAEKRATAELSIDRRGDEDDGPEPPDDEDPDALAAYEEQKRTREQQLRQKRMEAAIEPELMEKLMMLPLDERIRETDAPERFQLTGQADLRDAFSEEQLEDASRFILEQMVGPVPTEAGDPGSKVVARDCAAKSILERGILEVDGKPRDGRPRADPEYWERHELMEGVCDLTQGHRGVKNPRDRNERERWRADVQARGLVMQSITNVLKEMWNQRHEIPVIACFRKELCGELLSLREEDCPELTNHDDIRHRRRAGAPEYEVGTVQAKYRRLRRWEILWTVYDLAARWRAMVRRKERRTEVYQQALMRCESWIEAEGEGVQRLQELHGAIQACISQTAEAESMETLDNIDLKFRLVTSGIGEHFAEDLALGLRRPQRSSAYSLLKQANLQDVVKAMAMSTAAFGDNLERNLKRNEPEECRAFPIDMAYNFVSEDKLYDTPEKVLERARQIHVLEIVNEPRVREFVRRRIDHNMYTSTSPTQAGEVQLDAFHVFGCVKRIRNMPAPSFNGTDLYLRIHLAQKEGLINAISEVANLEELFVQPMLEFYQSSGVAPVAREWNSLRQAILREAVKKLVPQLQEETSIRLLNEAREAVIEAYSEEIWKYAALPPVQIKTEEGDVVERRRIAACCWGEGRPATCIAMLDEQGSLVDILYLPSFSGQQRAIRPGLDYSIAEDPKKAADVKRIVEFCRENRPQAIFVGARNLNCKALKEDMSRIGDFILDAHAQVLTSGHDTGIIEVMYAEETLAELWANSAAAKEEFPDHPDVVRRAVALGRLALEPLAVLASLCRPDSKEILSLNLHPLQTQVPEAELLKASERCLMTVIAQVGADINVMASNAWQAASLPFVAGLGPRKAQSLLQAVQAQESAHNRVSLWKEIWKPGNCVFRNCGAFLRITTKARSLVNAEVEPIDSARIEPLSYKLAFRLARQAVGGQAGDAQQDVICVNKAMSRPEMVEALNLEDLHDELREESNDPENFNQISTLVDIAMEFIAPNMELRPGNPMELAVQKETQFWWMVGDTRQSLKKGRRVEAVVRYVGQNEAKCFLPELGGLDAILSAQDISTNTVVSPADYVKVGQSLNARVKSVRAGEFSVDITTTSSDLNDEAYWEEKYSKGGNQFYHVQSAEERRAIENDKRRLARSKELTRRTIDHPNFRNININEAVRQLSTMPKGEAIFRPHARTTNLICLTMKLGDAKKEGEADLIVHKDVAEGRKRGGQLTLGTPLKIQISSGGGTMKKELTFEDLDEIVARYVTPMFEKYQEVMNNRKFRRGDWGFIQNALREEAMKMQQVTATYCLALDPMKPGTPYIACVLPTQNKSPRREYFFITPDGFYFRKKLHKDLERMLGVFKRNPQGSVEMQAPPPVPVPMAPPNLQAPGVPMQYAGFNPYQQPFQQQQQMHGGYSHAYEPQGINLMPRGQQRAFR